MLWRLSTLLFLAYAPLGAVLPLLSRRLEQLGLTPEQIGAVCATQALGALLAPLVAGQFADRWVAATALRLDISLVADDRIFREVPGLTVEWA